MWGREGRNGGRGRRRGGGRGKKGRGTGAGERGKGGEGKLERKFVHPLTKFLHPLELIFVKHHFKKSTICMIIIVRHRETKTSNYLFARRYRDTAGRRASRCATPYRVRSGACLGRHTGPHGCAASCRCHWGSRPDTPRRQGPGHRPPVRPRSVCKCIVVGLCINCIRMLVGTLQRCYYS